MMIMVNVLSVDGYSMQGSYWTIVSSPTRMLSEKVASRKLLSQRVCRILFVLKFILIQVVLSCVLNDRLTVMNKTSEHLVDVCSLKFIL